MVMRGSLLCWECCDRGVLRPMFYALYLRGAWLDQGGLGRQPRFCLPRRAKFWGLGRSPSGVWGGSPSTAAPQGDFFSKGGGAEATFLLKPEAGGQKNIESENEKVAPSKTCDKTGLRSPRPNLEPLRPKPGGVGPAPRCVGKIRARKTPPAHS